MIPHGDAPDKWPASRRAAAAVAERVWCAIRLELARLPPGRVRQRSLAAAGERPNQVAIRHPQKRADGGNKPRHGLHRLVLPQYLELIDGRLQSFARLRPLAALYQDVT